MRIESMYQDMVDLIQQNEYAMNLNPIKQNYEMKNSRMLTDLIQHPLNFIWKMIFILIY